MGENRANIDLLFRNGLKDYEVLPPPEVWENIRPAVRKGQRPVLIFRAAAMIAVLFSLGFLTYRWSMKLPVDMGSSSLIMNPAPENQFFASPVNNAPRQKVALLTAKQVNDKAIPLIKAENIMISADDRVAENADNKMPQDIIGLSVEKEQRIRGTLTNRKADFIKTTGESATRINPLVYPLASSPEAHEKNKNYRWSIAALISPTYYSDINTGHSAIASQLISDEQPVISYSGGLALSYKINKRFSVQSGLYYSTIGNELSGISSFTGFQKYDLSKGAPNFEVLTTNGPVYTSNPDIFLMDNLSTTRISTRFTADIFDPDKADLQYLNNSLMQNFGYLEFPVAVRYKVVDRKLGLNIIGGLSSDFLMNNTVSATGLNGERLVVGSTDGVKPVAFTSSVGMGMEYSISKNFSLNLEPTFRYYLNPFSGVGGSDIRPYSFGVFSGLSYRF